MILSDVEAQFPLMENVLQVTESKDLPDSETNEIKINEANIVSATCIVKG